MTALYLEMVMYDSNENEIFVGRAYVNTVEIDYFNNIDNSLNDFKKIKFKGAIENTNEGIIILGSL